MPALSFILILNKDDIPTIAYQNLGTEFLGFIRWGLITFNVIGFTERHGVAEAVHCSAAVEKKSLG